MALFLEVLSGPDAGKKYQLEPGLSLGRVNSDIVLPDRRVSSQHGLIDWDEKKEDLVFSDSDSANGTFVSENRVRIVILNPGVKFRVGDTLLGVIESEAEAPLDPVSNWQGVFKKYLSPRFLRILATPNESVRAFKQPLLLKVIEGVQTDTEWYIGWGPRRFGKSTLEFRMLEFGAPDVAFEISPNEFGDPVFSTAFPRAVLVNEGTRPSDFLEISDEIRVGNTLIKVFPALGERRNE